MAITTKSLPDQIPPQASPFVYDDGTGEYRLEIHWYLFLYHMWTVFSSSQGAFVLAQDALLQDPSSGGVSSVTGTLPIVSSGGSNPAISINVFGASGVGHSTGAVPDPGASAGATRFLREDATFAVPAGGSGISIGLALALPNLMTPL